MKIKEIFSEKVLTLPNFISISRILLVPVFGYFLYLENLTNIEKYKYYTLLITGLIILTDFLDGYSARLLNQVSSLGQFLDPISDKIAGTAGVFLLYVYKDFPFWIIIILLIRDIITIIGGFIMFSKRDVQVKPNILGKLMIFSLGVAAVVFILSPTFKIYNITLQQTSITVYLFFLIISTIFYWKTYTKVYFEKNL